MCRPRYSLGVDEDVKQQHHQQQQQQKHYMYVSRSKHIRGTVSMNTKVSVSLHVSTFGLFSDIY